MKRQPVSPRRIRLQLHKLGVTGHFYMVFLAILIGLLCGVGAILLRLAIQYNQVLFFGIKNPALTYVQSVDWYWKLLIPSAGGLLVGLIIRYVANEVKGHGVPEVMETIATKGSVIHPRAMFVRLLSTSVTIGSGGSVGREGPIVHIGSTIGSAIGQMFHVAGSRLRTLVGCGAAAGIAAAFNAPIAGALFAVEVILGDFAVTQFSPIVISSVTATILSRGVFGNYPAFEVPEYELVSALEMIPYALLGVLAGFASIFFIRTLYMSEDFFDHLKIPTVIKPAIGGLFVGVIALWYPHVFGVGYETIHLSLQGYTGGVVLISIFMAKIMATSLTVGSGGSGGIFAPSLFLGAMLGGFVGSYSHKMVPMETAGMGAYALVGMGAMVSGTLHAPITAILIIFELTSDYQIILPLMVACILSTVLSTRFQKHSMYTLKLVRKGIDLKDGQDVNILKHLAVHEVMDTNPVTVTRSESFEDIIHKFISSHHGTIFVLEKEGSLAGIVSFDHLRKVLPDWEELKNILIADDLMFSPMTLLAPEDTLDRAMWIFANTGKDELPVIGKDGRVAGILSKTLAIEGYNRELLKKDLAFEVRGGLLESMKTSEYRLSDDYILCSMIVPGPFVGKTLEGLIIRSRYNVEVVLIKKKNGEGVLPDAAYRFEHEDIICVIGHKYLIEAIRDL